MKSDAREVSSEIIIYQTEDGRTKIDVRMEDETVWLSQAQMVDLFQSSKANISEHIRHIFDEGELLSEDSVVRNFRTTAADGNYACRARLPRKHKGHPKKTGGQRYARQESLWHWRIT